MNRHGARSRLGEDMPRLQYPIKLRCAIHNQRVVCNVIRDLKVEHEQNTESKIEEADLAF